MPPPLLEEVTSPGLAVLPYDSTEYSIFPGARAAELTELELSQVEQLLAVGVEAHNEAFRRHRAAPEAADTSGITEELLPLRNYKRQVIPIWNARGEKEVLVHCFCQAPANWRTRFVRVSDGGRCYFDITLNLTRNTWYDLFVHGDA